jgi:valyl-tRNA synthetase
MSLEKAFQPETYESRVAELWNRAGIFRAGARPAAPPFTLVIPPPNVTGTLHIGHALTTTLQDIVVRWYRMAGFDALYIPGCDHAGIATQMVVERELRKSGTSRHELGREAFVDQIWKWKDTYRERIVRTLQRLGASCDWSRERFTMDPGFSQAVRETFVRLYEQGLIYRGTRMINWCTDCVTALSDLEVDREDQETGELWSFAYRVESGGEIVVATTRPETMLGDTAVAVHPEDPRWQALIGKRLIHPFFPERDLRVIADPVLADPEKGTGAVKVTPAHDPNDYSCGLRHGLAQISIFDERGKLNQQGGKFAGVDRFEARQRIKAEIAALGLDRGSKDHLYSPGRCQRCNTVVEPIISTQWFLKMSNLAAQALEAQRSGKVSLVPESWTKTYNYWLENIQDWCVSRQLWWGHRIPAWHCRACAAVSVLRTDPVSCPSCQSPALERDPDVLDTWFSSQLWPFATLGWPERTDDFARYYPTSVLVTGFDILFFWVARMIMSGVHLTGEVPFRTVVLHGMVRDAAGQKMSKTKGNAIEPEVAIAAHGTDALRFTLAALTVPGSDLALSEERLVGYRAFMNKLWNATRFLLMHIPEDPADRRVRYAADEYDEVDRYLVASYIETIEAVARAMADYRFDHATESIYHFLWGTYCDWSIELSKRDLTGPASRLAQVRLALLIDVLDGALRLLHPIAPFITEELWQQLPRREGDPEWLAVAALPTREQPGLPVPAAFDVQAAQQQVRLWLIEPVRAARLLRTSAGLAPSTRARLLLRPRDPAMRDQCAVFSERISELARASSLEIVLDPEASRAARVEALPHLDVILPLEGLIDIAGERARLEKDREKARREQADAQAKLDKPSFVERAPAEVVAKERARLAALAAKIEQLERQIAELT